MNFRTLAALIFSIGLGLTVYLVCLIPQAQGAEKTYGDVQGVIVSEHDGDTITIDVPGWPDIIGKNISVRVAGIDTPEMHDKDPLNRKAADDARKAVVSLCPVGSLTTIRNVWRDKYFRIGGTVFCNDVDIAKILIAKHLANPYDGGTKLQWIGGKPNAQN